MVSSPDPSSEPRHPIRVVTLRTGITPHVLRAWERRYGVVKPRRSAGGQRLYSDADLHRLGLLLKAVEAGRSISQVAPLDTGALERLAEEDAAGRPARTPLTAVRDQAMAAVQDFDTGRLDATLRRAAHTFGTATFLEEILAPVLVQVGAAWHAGRLGIANEHAATAVAHQMLGDLLRQLAVPGPRLVLGTPAGEPHALGAMIAAVAAAESGWRVTWLGADVPAEHIATACRTTQADAVALGLVLGAGARTHAEIAALRHLLPDSVPLFVGGAAAAVPGVPGITPVQDLAHWRALLRQHAPASPPARC